MARATGQLSNAGQERIALYKTEQIYRTIRTLIRSAAIVIGLYLAVGMVDSLAGKETTLNFAASLFADVKFVAAVSLAGFSGLWAIIERKMRQKTVERLHGRIKELEQMVDPNRSTSGLTRKGQTNPTDRR